jgi:hypothetical protein
MQTTVWDKAGMSLLAKAVHTGMNSLSGKHLIELTDGVETFIIDPDELRETATEISEDLVMREFDHTCTMQTHGGDQQATLNLLDTIMLQCMQMTSHGALPISLIKQEDINVVKDKRATLTDAVGFWQRATAFLDHEFDEENESEPKLVIRVVLNGVLFASRFKPETQENLKEFELEKNYQVHPRFNHDVLEGRGGNLSMDFDIVDVDAQPEFEEVSDEEAASLISK